MGYIAWTSWILFFQNQIQESSSIQMKILDSWFWVSNWLGSDTPMHLNVSAISTHLLIIYQVFERVINESVEVYKTNNLWKKTTLYVLSFPLFLSQIKCKKMYLCSFKTSYTIICVEVNIICNYINIYLNLEVQQ